MKKTKVKQNSKIISHLKENKILGKILKKSYIEKIPVIDKNTGRFLEVICLLTSPENILEIGCGIGFSSYFLVKNLKKGNYTGIDLNKERIKRAERFIKYNFPEKNLKFLTGNALKIIPELEDKFDMVFIDGAKYEYPLYIKAVEVKLDSGAIVIADNIFYKKKVFKRKVNDHDLNSVNGIRDYISYITNSENYISYFYDIGDGISVTRYQGKY